MAQRPPRTVLRCIRKLVAEPGMSQRLDHQLLRQFIAQRDESAFAELVQRHGPMVIDAARCVLHNVHDVEDVFQATFLVLARKADSIRKQNSLASWIYGVAYRLAMKTRARGAKRKTRELPSVAQNQPSATDEMTWRELRLVLHEELHRLPEKYRAPLVLCYFEGKTQDEAARHLGWNKWTFKNRLEQARDLMRARLTRRGLIPSAALFATLLSHDAASAVSSALLHSTLNAAMMGATGQVITCAISAQAARLVEVAISGMPFAKAKLAMALLLTLGIIVAGAGLAAYQAKNDSPSERQETIPSEATAKPEPPSTRGKEDLARTDRYGDPLPREVIARIGTVRFRHGDVIKFLTFSPDGKQLISQSDVVRVWETATGKELGHFTPGHFTPWPGDNLGAGSLSPDGKVLAVGLMQQGHIALFELATSRKLKEFGTGQYELVTFSPNGKTLAAIRRGPVELWDVATGQRLHAWDAHQQPWSATFARDGKTLLTSGRDKRVCFWDVATGKQTGEIKDCPTVWNFSFPACQTALTPDGTLLAAIRPMEDNETMSINEIGIWSVATGKELRRLTAPKQEIAPGYWTGFRALAFAPDGKLVTSGPDSNIRIWDTATGRELRRLPAGFDASFASFALSRDGQRVAGGAKTIRVIDLTDPQPVAPPIYQFLGAPGHLALNGGLAVTANGTAVLWDAATGKELRRLEHPSGIATVHLSAHGRILFAACGDNTVRAWDTATGREQRGFELKKDTAWAVLGDTARNLALAPDGKLLLAVAGSDGEIDVVNAFTGKTVRSFKQQHGYIYALAFGPEAQTLVTCFEDRTCVVWEVATGKKLRQFALPEDERNAVPGRPVFTAALSPDGKILAFGSQNRFLVLKDTVTGQDIRRLDKLPDGVCPLAFSPDGKTLAWAGWKDPTIHLVEVLTGQERRTLKGHGGRVLNLRFSSDGKRMISSGSDTTALIWDLSGKLSAGDRWGRPLSRKEIDAAWVDLAGADAARAFQATCRLAASSNEAIPYLRKQLKAVPAVDENRLARLIADLDSNQFATRENAAKELEKLGELAGPACRKALEQTPSAEMRRRLDALLEKQTHEAWNPSADRLRLLRAVEVLEHTATAEAKQVLASLAKGAPGARLSQEAKTSLERLDNRPVAMP